MVDEDILMRRLSALDEYLGELREFQTVSREDFISQPRIHHLAERLLHLTCECMLDMAQHLISDQGFRQPKGYKDTIKVLCDEGILEEDLAKELEGWMGFRNVLVHLYLELDHRQSYDTICHELDTVEAFAQRMHRYLS